MRLQKYFSNDDYYLLRKHMYQHALKMISCLDVGKSVLEIGPSTAIYEEKISEFNTSIIGNFCRENGIKYKTLDIEGSNVDYVGSIELLSELIVETFDIIIALGVLEHVANIFVVPEQVYKRLNDNGKFFINTPFLFKVHGPIPDYWRISEYGFKYLFSNRFYLEFDVFPENELGKNSFPLSMNVICTKR